MSDNSITIHIIDRKGVQHDLEAPTDMNMNVMEVCRAHELPIEGRCGGMALCATCQCYLESNHKLPEQSDSELDMLDEAFFVEDNSRLGCQIHIKAEIDGIILKIAPDGN